MRKLLLLASFVGIVGVLTSSIPAAPKVDTDGTKEYPCTPAVGAWVICVHEFRGPDSAELARQLALQIRQRDNLPAYVFNFSEQQKRQIEAEWEDLGKINPDGTPRKFHVNIPEERVVLIGGFSDMKEAAAALKEVKKLDSPQLHLPGKTTLDTAYVYVPTPDGKGRVTRATVNPFLTSFVAPNPSIPHKTQTKKVDPILVELNRDEDYSLLRNPKKWTLAVKEYAGDSMVVSQASAPQASVLDKLFSPQRSCQVLAATAMQAHELARLLRTKVTDKCPFFGFESYVLHTRHTSIVTVGSFTGPDDPEMQRTAEKIQQLKLNSKNARMPSIELFTVPMEVPRP